MVLLNGLMGESILGIGKMESNMARVPILMQTD